MDNALSRAFTPLSLLRFALPNMVMMVFLSLYTIVDGIFISRYVGTLALSAVNMAYPLNCLQMALGIMLASGGSAVIARKMGEGKDREARRDFSCVVAVSAVVGAVFLVLGNLFLDEILRLLGTSPAQMDLCRTYTRILLWFAPAFFLQTAYQVLFVTAGLPGLGLGLTVAGGLANVVLDITFMGPLDMGIAGAAWATIFSQFVSFCLLLVGCTRGGNLHIHISRVQLKWPYFRTIIQGGLPSLARQGLASVATICLNQAAKPYGDTVIAALGIVQRIMMFGGSAMIGFGQGFQPVCGFNFGARLYHRVQEGFWFCVKTSAAFLLAVSVVGFAFAPQIVALFQDDPQVIACGSAALRFQCITFCFQSWIVMSNMMLQTIGRTVPATFVAMARQGIFFIPLVWILSTALGVTGLQITQSISDLLTLAFAIPIQRKVLRELSDS